MKNGILNPSWVADQGFIKNYSVDLVQPNSVDLRLKDLYVITSGIIIHADGRRELPMYDVQRPNSEGFYVLEPSLLYQVEFEEEVFLPEDIAAITVLRSSMNKAGSSGEVGLFDSGYQGGTGITLGVRHTSYVEVGAPVAQMIFFHAESSHLYSGFYASNSWPMEFRRDQGLNDSVG